MTSLLYFLTALSYLVPVWVILKSQLIANKMSSLGAPNWLSYVTGWAMVLYIGINTAYLVSAQLTDDTISIYYRMMHLIFFLLPLAFQRLTLKLSYYVDWDRFNEKENTRIHVPKHQYKKGA